MKTINNNIEETKVGFNNAKLLKEKGFDVPCSTHWEWGNGDKKENLPAGIYIAGFIDKENLPRPYSNSELMKSYFEDSNQFGEFSRPTQQLAIDWILKNYNIWIHVAPENNEEDIVTWRLTIQRIDTEVRFVRTFGEFNKPEEAKEAAINYVLTKLI